MSDIIGTVVRVSDAGLHAYSYTEDGDVIAESRIPATDIIEVIESDDESDHKRLQHGPDPEEVQ